MGSREDDIKRSRLGLGPKETDELVDKLTEVAMKERRKKILESSASRPIRQREDPTTPLIREVPFGPNTRAIEAPEHENLKVGDDPKNFDYPSQSMKEFDKFEAEQNKLPKDKAFPMHFSRGIGFRVIPHGGISIPKEQERKHIPFEKRDWDHGRLKSRGDRSHQQDEDAKEIALHIMNNEKPSRFVNQQTHKIRPPKPVRSDYASIISAQKGFHGVVKKETILRVGEGNKPEYVDVTPLAFRTNKKGEKYPIKGTTGKIYQKGKGSTINYYKKR